MMADKEGFCKRCSHRGRFFPGRICQEEVLALNFLLWILKQSTKEYAPLYNSCLFAIILVFIKFFAFIFIIF